MKDLENFLNVKSSPGEIVRAFRSNFKISQKDLAHTIGILDNNLSAIENGKRELGLDIAKKIASFFGIDPSLLLFPQGIDEVFEEHKSIRLKAKKLLKKKKIA